MKIILVSGDDQSKVEDRVFKLTESAKEKTYKIIEITDTLTDFTDVMREDDLFQTKKFIKVDKFSLLKKEDLKMISDNLENENIVLCIKSTAPVATAKLKPFLKYLKVENYNLPKVIWYFLDSLKAESSKKALELYKKVIETEPVELVFFLVSQRFIQLYIAKTSASSLKLPSWQAVKLQNQAEGFTEKDLKTIIKLLAKLDVDSKTGKADLRTHLDFLLATTLE